MKFGLREIVFISLLMLIPVGAWWFVFRPQNTRNVEMRRQIEARQAKLRDLNLATGTLGDLKSEIGSLTKAITFFQSKLPSEKEIDKILQEIWLLAESNKLNTKSIRTLDRKTDSIFTTEESDQSEQPIAIHLEGDFRGFYSFMLALENQPRIMRIRSMKLTKIEQGPEGSMMAEFEMSIFFERNKAREDQQWPSRS